MQQTRPRNLPRVSRNVFAQGTVDPGLIALAIRRAVLEPGHQVGIQAPGKLLLDGPVKQTAPSTAPVPLLRDIARIDLVFRQRGQSLEFGPLGRGQIRHRLLSLHGWSLRRR